jgi:hypothetical protein
VTTSIGTTTGTGGQVSVYTTAVPESFTPSGLTLSDKIALGVGIGIGLPAAVAGIWMCIMQMAKF